MNHDTIEIVLAILAIVSALIAKSKSKRAALVRPLIEAIENFDSKLVKSKVRAAAQNRGVAAAMHKAVKQITDPKI